MMALTKSDIVKSVMENTRIKKSKRERQQYLFPEFDFELLNKKRATELVDALLEIIKERLVEGEDVLVTGFGKFQVRFKWARKGRNPQTGEGLMLRPRRVVTFQCSSVLKDKINGKG